MAKKFHLSPEVSVISKQIKFISNSSLETIRLGRRISNYLKEGQIICMFGELGTGKTTLVRGIAGGLGIKKEEIISPSFMLFKQCIGKKTLNHFDLYRLNSEEELLDLGYEEFFYSDAISVIEWSERLRYLLPREFLKINFRHLTENKRLITILGIGRIYEDLVNKIKLRVR